MAEASKKPGKYEGMSQEAFEKKMQREMLGVVKKTEKMAVAACASEIEGTGSNPPMAKAVNPPEKGKETKETKSAETTKKGK